MCAAHLLYTHYQSHCSDKGITCNSEHSFKKAVSSLYVITTSTTQLNHKTVSIYKGIVYCPNPVSQPISTDTLTRGWFIVSQECNEVILGSKTGIYISDVEIHREIVIKNNGDVDMIIRNQHINPLDIGLPNTLNNSCLKLEDYLMKLTSVNICLGKLHNGSGSVKCMKQGESTQRKFSKTCVIVLSLLSPGDTCQWCHSTHTQRDPMTHGNSETIVEGEHSTERNDFIPIHSAQTDADVSDFFPGANETLVQFIKAQAQCCKLETNGKDPRTRRWSGEVLSLSMSMWIASPVTYTLFCKYFYMPSEKLLQLYKNNVNKDPGVTHDMVSWMYHECKRTKTPPIGGVIFDEMAIQPGIQLQPKGTGLEMFGYVDFGEGTAGIHNQQKSGSTLQLASTALQFLFLGLNGFRFPFCYMLNKGLTAGQLCTIFWNIISTLQTYDFQIVFICMDGASTNRAFLNMICDSSTYIARNIATMNEYIACIMDYSHVIKKFGTVSMHLDQQHHISGRYSTEKDLYSGSISEMPAHGIIVIITLEFIEN